MESEQEKYTPLLIETLPGSYAMFIPPDMAYIKQFRRSLRHSLESNGFRDEDIVQIELAADEALTNSVSANVTCACEETIICRWVIRDLKIKLYILDYGAGFKTNPSNTDPEESEKPANMKCFLEKIRSHQASKPDSYPFHGIKMGHKNIGKGLKIIYTLMDSVKILFHSDGKVLEETSDGSQITGSIVELEYDGKKRIHA